MAGHVRVVVTYFLEVNTRSIRPVGIVPACPDGCRAIRSVRFLDSVKTRTMASVRHPSRTRWVVHLASTSEADSEVAVELRMSRATAENLVHTGCSRMAKPNRGRSTRGTPQDLLHTRSRERHAS